MYLTIPLLQIQSISGGAGRVKHQIRLAVGLCLVLPCGGPQLMDLHSGYLLNRHCAPSITHENSYASQVPPRDMALAPSTLRSLVRSDIVVVRSPALSQVPFMLLWECEKGDRKHDEPLMGKRQAGRRARDPQPCTGMRPFSLNPLASGIL